MILNLVIWEIEPTEKYDYNLFLLTYVVEHIQHKEYFKDWASLNEFVEELTADKYDKVTEG